jgi:hypothetical protein
MAREPNQPEGDGSADFVRNIVTDPNNVPDVMRLYGYPGPSSEEGYDRLYVLNLNQFVEIPSQTILHRMAVPADQDPYGAVVLWVKKDAALVYKMAPAEQARAHYFAGAIQAGMAGMAAAAPEAGAAAQTAFAVCATLNCTTENTPCLNTHAVTCYCPHTHNCPTDLCPSPRCTFTGCTYYGCHTLGHLCAAAAPGGRTPQSIACGPGFPGQQGPAAAPAAAPGLPRSPFDACQAPPISGPVCTQVQTPCAPCPTQVQTPCPPCPTQVQTPCLPCPTQVQTPCPPCPTQVHFCTHATPCWTVFGPGCLPNISIQQVPCFATAFCAGGGFG